MLTTLKNAFKIKEIRKKLLFTFLMLVVIRIGCSAPGTGCKQTLLLQLVRGADRRYV